MKIIFLILLISFLPQTYASGCKALQVGENVYLVSYEHYAALREHIKTVANHVNGTAPVNEDLGFFYDIAETMYVSGKTWDEVLRLTLPKGYESLPAYINRSDNFLHGFANFAMHTFDRTYNPPYDRKGSLFLAVLENYYRDYHFIGSSIPPRFSISVKNLSKLKGVVDFVSEIVAAKRDMTSNEIDTIHDELLPIFLHSGVSWQKTIAKLTPPELLKYSGLTNVSDNLNSSLRLFLNHNSRNEPLKGGYTPPSYVLDVLEGFLAQASVGG